MKRHVFASLFSNFEWWANVPNFYVKEFVSLHSSERMQVRFHAGKSEFFPLQYRMSLGVDNDFQVVWNRDWTKIED